MTRLLVSVRSAAEAETALAGGAHLIDVKEPAHGSLGRPADETIREVLACVAGRAPVSAALGELQDEPTVPPATDGLAFAKWGLARLGSLEPLNRAAERLQDHLPGCRLVTVAYADYQQARSPAPPEVLAFALQHRRGPLLLDTFAKDGSNLLDHIAVAELARLCRECRRAGVPVALAGALGSREIRGLRAAEPTWVAVRGAVCRDGQRGAAIDKDKVRALVSLL